MLLIQIASVFPALRFQQKGDCLAGTLIETTSGHQPTMSSDGVKLLVKKPIYPEPGGYVKMRVRDMIAGALVVSCFALAVLLSYIWRNIVKISSRRSRIKYENKVT